MPSLRRATPDDVEDYLAVVQATAEERRWIATEPPADTPQRRARFARETTSDLDVVLFVEEDGRVLGHGALHAGSGRGIGEVGMALLPSARGRGLGGLLLDGLLDHARSGPFHKVELQVWPHNGRAIALYASRGFVVEGLLKSHYRRQSGELWDALVMGLVLPSAA